MDDRKPDCGALLALFGMQLKGSRFLVEPDGDGALSVTNRDARTLAVTCELRAADGDRPWFFGDGEPLAEADQPVTAMVAIRGILARGGGAR